MSYAFVGGIIILVLFLYQQNARPGRDAPFVPTDADVVQRIMKLAQISEKDTVYDLGSGDGRFVIAAAMKGAKAYGVELNILRVWYARLWIFLLRLSNASILRKDIFETDLSKATVVICYLLQETNDKLQKKLAKELPLGARVVSVAFKFKDWKETAKDMHGVYYGVVTLYTITKKIKKTSYGQNSS